MTRSIGIDLGTTNTAVAAIVDGRPRVLEDEKGYKVLPSCVSSKGKGRYVIGQAAKNLVLSAPDDTVYAVKRLIGRRFDSPEITQARQRMGYGIEAASDGGVRLRLGKELLTPTEVSSVILQVARQIAERRLGGPIDEAVITVPAHFTHAQRESTLQAAKLAGLRCERILNEPTAAALAYGFRKDIDRQLLIFDLGGGTFDVCVLRLSTGVYEILATSGDSYLGGEDFDFRLVDHMADHFQSLHGVDLRDDRMALQRLKDAAERAKCELSFTDRTTVLIPRILENTNLEMVISRQTLESLVDDLIVRTIELARSTVADSGLQLAQIDDVVLVGGQTRMPKVREAITGFFGREPSRSVHPEEAVAIGAAVHAAALSHELDGAPILLDVTPFDLGIDSLGGQFAPIISKNSKVPASRTRVFATVHDNQDKVKIVVRQGDSLRSDQNEFLGEFVLEGISPKARMESKLDVTFRLDVNGMLHVAAQEQGTTKKVQITIRNYAEVAQAKGTQVRTETKEPSTGDIAEISTESVVEIEDEGAGAASPVAVADEQPAKAQRSIFQSLLSRFRRPKAGAPIVVPEGGVVTDGAETNGGDAVLLDEVAVEPLGSRGEEDIRINLGAAPTPVEASIEASVDALASLDDDPGIGNFVDDDMYGGARQGRGAAVGLAGEGAGYDDYFSMPDDDAPGPLPIQHLEETDLMPFPDEDRDRGPTRSLRAPERSPSHAESDDLYSEEPTGENLDSISPPTWMESMGIMPDEAPRQAPRPTQVMGGAASPDAQIEKERGRKPARLRMHYSDVADFVREYRENMRVGGTFIKSDKPLAVGRSCVFEVHIPGRTEPLTFAGVVATSTQVSESGYGQEAGMSIEYQLTKEVRAEIERVMRAMSGR